MIARERCITGLEMGMYHKPSVLFLCPFKISVLPLIILISFLSYMAIQSFPHSWPKEIMETLCNPSKICSFFAWALRILARGVFPVIVALIVLLFGSWTVGPSLVFLHFLVLICLQFASNYLTRHCHILQLSLHVAVGLQ